MDWRLLQSPRLLNRIYSHPLAGPRRQRIRGDQQHHGRRQNQRHPNLLVVGGMLVKPANWTPFAPSGFAGIVTGGAIVFFTYIGFDSVSTAAEESRNPQKDLPFGIIMSLIVCTLLYVGVAVVLLGMMKYTTFVSGEAAEAPVAYALKVLGAH